MTNSPKSLCGIKFCNTILTVMFFCVLFFCTGVINAATYYVATTGDDTTGDGSLTFPWKTIQKAADMAVAGDTVYIKAGDYGAETVELPTSGTAGAQITFEGYKTNPGDVITNDYCFGDILDSSDMPLLDGQDRTTGTAINTRNHNYITIKNIQIQNYSRGIIAEASSNCVIQNCVTIELGDRNAFFDGFGIKVGSNGHNNIVRDCAVANSCAEGFEVSGNYNIIENCEVYCDDDSNDERAAMDYYILVVGNYNQVTGCYAERIGDLPHPGHGIILAHDSEHNIIKDCISINFGNCFNVRHSGVKYNLIENCTAIGNGITGTKPSRGLAVTDGASYNTYRNCRTIGVNEGIVFFYFGGDATAQSTGSYNTFENCIFEDTIEDSISFHYYNFYGSYAVFNNKFINCTFDGGDYLFKCDRENYGNELINCIITGVNALAKYEYKDENNNYYTLNYTVTYTDFYNNGFSTPAGTGNFSSDPLFTDVANGDFSLNPNSPCIDAGTTVALNFDYNYLKRPYGSYFDVGAHEYNAKNALAYFKLDENTGNSTADAMSNISSGTINGAAWATGVSGSALSFDGVNDNVNFGQPSLLDLAGSRTMSAWIKPDTNSPYKCIVARSMWKESLFLSYGQLRAIVAGTVTDADSISNETVTNGEWQHVAMTFNVNGDKKIRLYINGQEVNSYSRQYELEGSVQSTASYDFLIGSDQWNSYWFDGMIDEVKIYEKALSEQKIFDEYATVFCAELDEKGGSTVHDLHGITGSISGAGWVTGLSGSALSFDGIDDNVDFGNPSALDLNGSRTISAWIKPDTKSPYKCIVSKSIWKASLFLSYGQLRAIVGGTVTDADSISNETVTNGEWQHVAMTFDVNGDKKIRLYINGQEVNSYSRQYTLEGSVASTAIYNFSIGSDHGTGYWFDGAIDKVKIFNIPLSTQEIFAQYKDSAIFSASLDEGSGSSINDSSIHENTGVISGATWATGLSGSALDFDGIDDNVDFGSPSVLDLTGSRTMSAWIKSDTNSPYKCIVAKSMWKSSLFLSYGKLRGIVAGTTTDADSISNETVTNGTWHHVVMAFDAKGDKKVHLYLDGQEVTYSRQYQLEGFVGSAAIYNFSIGSDHGSDYWFDGMIDEVNVYSRALSGNEISNIYLSY